MDIIVIALCAITCCGDSLDAMDYFGHKHEKYLREFLELPNGILDADTIRRVFEQLDTRELASCLNELLGMEHQKRCTIAIDKYPKHSTTEIGHGRVETREYTLCNDIEC